MDDAERREVAPVEGRLARGRQADGDDDEALRLRCVRRVALVAVRRRGVLERAAPGVGRCGLALVARDLVREPALDDELRGAGLRAHGRGIHIVHNNHDEVVAFLE